MSVKIRLRRMGARNQPSYRVVVVDSRKKRDGIYLESIGYYDPKTDPLTLKVDIDNALKWLKLGAQPSDTVRSLFRKAGVMEMWHNLKFSKKEEKVEKKKVKKPEKKTEAPIEKTEDVKVEKKTIKPEETKTEKKTVKKTEDKKPEEIKETVIETKSE